MLWPVRWWRVPLPEIVLSTFAGFGVSYDTDAELILTWLVLMIPSFVLSLVVNFAPVRSFLADALFIIFGVRIIAGTIYYFRDVDGPVFSGYLLLRRAVVPHSRGVHCAAKAGR